MRDLALPTGNKPSLNRSAQSLIVAIAVHRSVDARFYASGATSESVARKRRGRACCPLGLWVHRPVNAIGADRTETVMAALPADRRWTHRPRGEASRMITPGLVNLTVGAAGPATTLGQMP